MEEKLLPKDVQEKSDNYGQVDSLFLIALNKLWT